ncbi:hypothetical protein EMIT0P176_150071 [Pseudomonas sp. IT-P176]
MRGAENDPTLPLTKGSYRPKAVIRGRLGNKGRFKGTHARLTAGSEVTALVILVQA